MADGKDLYYCVLAPNGESLAYVLENNIYYVKMDEDRVYSITSNGITGLIVMLYSI